MASEATRGLSGMDVASYRDYRGVPVIGAWLWSKDLGIGLATEIDADEALASYLALRNLVIGALGVTVLLALALTGLSVWLGDRAKVRLERLVEERTRELKKLVQAVEQSPLCVVITDVDGNIEHVNPAFTRITGYQSDEVLGKNPRLLKSGETSPDQYANLWQTILEGKVWRSEIRNRKKNGEIYWGSVSIAPVTDDAGTVTHFVAMTEDITEAKEVELALRRSEQQFRTLFNATTIPMVSVDADENMMINPNFTEVLGYTSEDMPTLTEWWPLAYPDPDYRQWVIDNWETAVQRAAESNTDIKSDEYRVTCKNGEVRRMVIGGSITEDFFLAIFIDVTEIRQAEEAMRQAKEAADAANQAKSAFLANMSHELRTPMNAILGYSEMLIEEAEDLDQQDSIPDLQKINKAGTHLLALINDVLDLAKVESGKMEAFAEDIDIDNLIDEVSGTTHPLMEKNNNTLSIERGNELGSAHQDLTKLRQTLFNLLSNAAKFTHDGTITLHVNRSVESGVDWLTFAVSDTGIGIAADKIEHVFEEFTQADDSTTRDYGGTGLGLAISRRFCELLGGDLSA
ncbi:MAG: PAS domain S-box protein, partial [Pseudomonadota bacterium]|nr:PAS domain S-box protein [Pseudomonadota bacterium]